MKKKVLLSSIAMIAICLSLIAGSTFALFTKSTNVNIAVTAGNLDVYAAIQDDIQIRSLGVENFAQVQDNKFPNGGSATLSGGKLNIEQMTPGDAVSFEIQVVNNGDVAVAYSVDWASAYNTSNPLPTGKKDMFEALKFTVTTKDGKSFTDAAGKDVYYTLGEPGKDTTFVVTVEFENKTGDANNAYQGAVADINFTVKTVQANGIDSNGNIIDN